MCLTAAGKDYIVETMCQKHTTKYSLTPHNSALLQIELSTLYDQLEEIATYSLKVVDGLCSYRAGPPGPGRSGNSSLIGGVGRECGGAWSCSHGGCCLGCGGPSLQSGRRGSL